MKRSLCILLCLLLQLVSVHAESYVVLSGTDNTIVEEKSKNEKQSAASISKTMAAVIAIEHGRLDESSTADGEVNKAYGSSVYLKQGQQITIRNLLYRLMLRSGNDAVVEIARHATGSQGTFVELMNYRTAEIGMSDTTSSNLSGLDEEDGDSISATNDTTVLMSHVMKDKEFRTITGSKYYTTDWNVRWKNKSRLLFDYPFTVGGETGLIRKAGQTLVSAVEHGDMGSIIMTLRGRDDFAFRGQKHTEVFQKMDVITIMRKGGYMVNGKKFHVPETLKVALYKDGDNKLRVRTYHDHKDFAVEVQKNDDVNVYNFVSKRVRGGGLFS